MEEDSKGLKALTFNGKKEQFIMWQAKFMSYAHFKKFNGVLQGTSKLIVKDILDPDEQTSNEKFKSLNAQAYSTLSLCVRDHVSFLAIYNARTTELPDGCALKAWQNLQDIFKPVSSAKKHEIEQAFNKSSLDKEQKNPDEWFAELERYRLQLKLDFDTTISDNQMISQIVYNCHPQPYKMAITILKRDLNRNLTISLDNVKDDLRQIYASLKHSSNKREHETALIGKPKFKKQFKGSCRTCGKIGHKSADCWTLDSNKTKRPKNYKNPKSIEKGESANISTSTSKDRYCTYCKRNNHTVDFCWKKKADEGKTNIKSDKDNDKSRAAVMMIAISRNEVEMLMSTTDGPQSLTFNTFICDSGASCHMRNSLDGMTDLEPHEQPITVGNNETMYSSYIGKFHGTIIQQDGKRLDLVLNDVLYIPDLWLNLISVTKALKSPNTQLSSTGELIKINFMDDDQTQYEEMIFDKIFTTGNGQLLGVEIIPKDKSANTDVSLLTQTQKQYEFEYFHEILGHPNENVVKHTAQTYNIKLTEPRLPCKSCAAAKQRKAPIPKVAKRTVTNMGERINIDISYINSPSFGGNKYWLLIQDSYTDYLWSFFIKHKSETSEKVLGWVNHVHKKYNVAIKTIRCDNSLENVKLSKDANESKEINISFEFTAPNTPQQNGQIERKFQTLYGKVRSMLNWGKFPKPLRSRLWAQCAKHATFLENVIYKPNLKSSSFEMLTGTKNQYIPFLKRFGEMAIVYDNKEIKSKLENKGKPSFFVGYPENHSLEVCEFINIDTNSINLSRNYTWLNESYGQYMNLDIEIIPRSELILEGNNEDFDISELYQQDPITYGELNPNMDQEGLNDDQSIEIIEQIPHENIEIVELDENGDIFESESENESEEDTDNEHVIQPRISGVNRALRHLQTYFNPNPWEHLEQGNEQNLTATIYDGNPEPKTFQETKKSKNWKEWWDAISTEFDNMEEKGVWEICEKDNVPSGRKIIGNRWVFSIKDDGRFRARTVAKGYSQIPGEDFQENFAPVINDTTLHIILVLKTMMNLKMGQFDIETAFLYGDLEEDIWMGLPDGYVEYYENKHGKKLDPGKQCLKLKKSLYGLVQAARQWWKKFKEVLIKLEYLPSEIDPCLFIKNKSNGDKSFLVLYVDDGGIFGTEKDIKETIQALRETFNVKDLGTLENFVGCKLICNDKNKSMVIHQPKLLKHLNEEFNSSNMKHYKTPAGPKTSITRPIEGESLINTEQQTKYRSGVGMLLYLVKHSRPEISNAVRELSKVCDGANMNHWKCLMRTIQYVNSTYNIGLKIKPKPYEGKYILKGISDSEYAGDKDNRISVYGYVIYLNDAPISWKSKSGRSVTLSSTEAEYFAISECAKELIFIRNVMLSIGIKLEEPIEIHVDNIGAIYLSNNYTTSQRTKHIDVRVHFVRQYIEKGIFKVVFVKSEDNDADIFTKNTTEEIFEKHSNKMVTEIEE
jgi:Reverse transcriptase (RNA-dependent DNA polymerase)